MAELTDTFLPSEPEILDARQGFPDAQAALGSGVLDAVSGLYGCGWYGTSVSRERGSFALVNRDGPLESIIGDRVKLTSGDHSTFVYVIGSADLDWDIHITRRSFAALSLLAVDRIDVTVEVVSS